MFGAGLGLLHAAAGKAQPQLSHSGDRLGIMVSYPASAADHSDLQATVGGASRLWADPAPEDVRLADVISYCLELELALDELRNVAFRRWVRAQRDAVSET